MLEKPPIQDEVILSAVADEYGLAARALAFLPVGYDVNTAVYRLEDVGRKAYFLKLRKGVFDPLAALLPEFLRDQGNAAVMAALPARSGLPWGRMEGHTLLLYPFVEGANAWARPLTGAQWRALGAALRHIHAAALPPELQRELPRETFSPLWRNRARAFLEWARRGPFADEPAEKLAALLRAERGRVERMLERAGRLAGDLAGRGLPAVVCHTDLHGGNVHVAQDGRIFIVDWDNPLLAPRERDLMFFGAGMGDDWSEPRSLEFFYQGYGAVEIDRAALAYYRYERVIADIAAFCAALWETGQGGADREQSYRYCAGNFLPGREIETAERTDPGRQADRGG